MPTAKVKFTKDKIKILAEIYYSWSTYYRELQHRYCLTSFTFYLRTTDQLIGRAKITLNKKCDETELEADTREEIDMAYSAKGVLFKKIPQLDQVIHCNTSHISYISSDSDQEQEQVQKQEQGELDKSFEHGEEQEELGKSFEHGEENSSQTEELTKLKRKSEESN